MSLFIAALKFFQAMDTTDKLAYSSVAGEIGVYGFVSRYSG